MSIHFLFPKGKGPYITKMIQNEQATYKSHVKKEEENLDQLEETLGCGLHGRTSLCVLVLPLSRSESDFDCTKYR